MKEIFSNTEIGGLMSDCGPKRRREMKCNNAVYGMGMIGAWVYFIGSAPTFWDGVTGFFKGLFWPGFFVFEALKYFGV